MGDLQRHDAPGRRIAALSGHLNGDGAAVQAAALIQRLQAVPVASEQRSEEKKTMKRAVIVLGVRTPFVKAFGPFRKEDSLDLGVAAVQGLIKKTNLDPRVVDIIVYGNVIVSTAAPNIAREIVIDLNLPRRIAGTTVSMACLSGLEAVQLAVAQIEHGDVDVAIAGGSDCMSAGELPMPKKFTQAFAKYQMGGGNKNGWPGMRELLKEAGPPHTWFPKANSISERSTGKTMGYHADLMAEMNGVTREEQDVYSIESHNRAAAAQKKGIFGEEIVPVTPRDAKKPVDKDNIIRASMDPKKVADLPPVFRPRPKGTITAASASPLTDGASAVLIMEESKARQLGYPTDVSVRAYVKVGIEPHPQLLLAPAIAIAKILDQTGLSVDDIDLYEIHEAFAGQVLATLRVLESEQFAKEVLKRDKPVGRIPRDRINPYGGSLAVGHPFAATGGRLVAAATNELRRSNKKLALISICAAGGLGGVMILERIPSASK